MEKNKQDLPYDLRPSRSGPAILKGLWQNSFSTQQCLDGVAEYVIFFLPNIFSNWFFFSRKLFENVFFSKLEMVFSIFS